MKVLVYRSEKKTGCYLYAIDAKVLEELPQTLKSAVGELTFTLEFELHEKRSLATQNPQTVLQNLQTTGYHVQLNDPLELEKLT